MKRAFLLASCATATFWVAPAAAQQAGTPGNDTKAAVAQDNQAVAGQPTTNTQTASSPNPANAQAASTEAQSAGGIQDIIVTAERREQTVQRSSLAIEVYSGAQLQAVTRPADLTKLSPGVQVGMTGPQPQVYIRGVGDVASNSRTQGAVAFNIDGIYYARGTQVTPSFFDVARIEVLKGPQGTLYGRNASGGAVNVITNRPVLGQLSGYVSGEVGAYDLKQGNAAINIPIGETLAVRFAGQIIDRNGYTSDGGQDQKTKGGRVRVLWQPSETVSLLVNGDILHIGGIGSGVVVKPSPDGNPWHGNVETPYAFPFLFGPGSAPLTAPTDRFIDSNAKGVSGELNLKLGHFATLTVIPAYRYQDQQYVAYSQNFRFYEGLKDKQTSYETRLGNDSEFLKWVVGLYYFQEIQATEFAPTMNNRSAVQFNTKLRSKAEFAQATLSITPALRVIGGARYTTETTTGGFTQGTGLEPVIAFVGTSPTVDIGRQTFSAFNYKVGTEYDLTSHSMLFATFSTGFKGGGFSQTVSCGADAYAAEKLYAFTLGSRNRFFDNKLQVNLEAFRWKYKNQQISFTGADSCGSVSQLVRNPGDATLEGGNIDVVLRASQHDTLHGGVEYNHSVYDRFLLTQFGIGQYTPAGGTLCSATPTTGRAGFFDINCTGQQVPRTPTWAATTGYEHVFDLANDSNVTFGTDAQFASARWLDYSFLPNGRAHGYAVVNANLTYNAPSKRWSLGAYVTNLTNEDVYTGGSSIATLAPNGYRYYTANILPPRMYGARARVNF